MTAGARVAGLRLTELTGPTQRPEAPPGREAGELPGGRHGCSVPLVAVSKAPRLVSNVDWWMLARSVARR